MRGQRTLNPPENKTKPGYFIWKILTEGNHRLVDLALTLEVVPSVVSTAIRQNLTPEHAIHCGYDYGLATLDKAKWLEIGPDFCNAFDPPLPFHESPARPERLLQRDRAAQAETESVSATARQDLPTNFVEAMKYLLALNPILVPRLRMSLRTSPKMFSRYLAETATVSYKTMVENNWLHIWKSSCPKGWADCEPLFKAHLEAQKIVAEKKAQKDADAARRKAEIEAITGRRAYGNGDGNGNGRKPKKESKTEAEKRTYFTELETPADAREAFDGLLFLNGISNVEASDFLPQHKNTISLIRRGKMPFDRLGWTEDTLKAIKQHCPNRWDDFSPVLEEEVLRCLAAHPALNGGIKTSTPRGTTKPTPVAPAHETTAEIEELPPSPLTEARSLRLISEAFPHAWSYCGDVMKKVALRLIREGDNPAAPLAELADWRENISLLVKKIPHETLQFAFAALDHTRILDSEDLTRISRADPHIPATTYASVLSVLHTPPTQPLRVVAAPLRDQVEKLQTCYTKLCEAKVA